MKNTWTVNVLLEKLKDDDLFVRTHAATLIGSLGTEARSAVPALIDLLESGDVLDRRLAALTLGEIGPAATNALAALLLAAHTDGDETVAQLASDAVQRIYLEETEREAA
jgi:HEAT repeat protein